MSFTDAGLKIRDRLVPLIRGTLTKHCHVPPDDIHLAGSVIDGLSVLNFNTAPEPEREQIMADLVAFLKTLTDERVRRAAAPFDHPQLFVPNGHPGDHRSVAQEGGQAVDSYVEIPATGRRGGRPLPGFLEE